MNLKYFTYLLCGFLVITCMQCAMTKHLSEQKMDLPNMVHIEDYLYADETEISNAGYLLYLQWMETVYGENGVEYLLAIPDTSKIECFGISGEQYFEYFLGQQTENHPVVGVSLSQAISYTNWRTNRVIEYMLVEAGHLKVNPDQNPKNCFTVERYIEGDLEQIIKHTDFKGPIYRMPTKFDWMKMNETMGSKRNEMFIQSVHNVDTVLAYQNIKPVRIIPNNYHYRKSRDKTIYHLYGNVAEMVGADESKGGSWRHTFEQSQKDTIQRFDSPNCWTGFRTVASLFDIKVKTTKEE